MRSGRSFPCPEAIFSKNLHLNIGWNIHEVVVHGFAMNSKGNRASISVGLVVGDEV